MKVAIIGAAGQLGSDLTVSIKQKGMECTPLTRQDLDVTDLGLARTVLNQIRPDVVINTAAFHKVDLCEDEPEKSFSVNAVGARNIAIVCREIGAAITFISTDYVFSGTKRIPYVETDPPAPLSVYGVSKLAGEGMTRVSLEKHFIIRTTGLYGVSGIDKGGSFVETVLRFMKDGKQMRVVNDQVLTPTSTMDLARKLADVVQTKAYGLYHITNDGKCSWYEFAVKILELSDLKGNISPITSAEFGAKAQRPAYSVLENRRLKEAGMDDLPPWEEALTEYMKKRRRL